jgi:hypothetical protein
MATLIRDALEAVLLAGVKAWGLEVSAAEVRDGVQCFQDDCEILTAAEALGIPENTLITLPCFLEHHPGVMDGEEACRAFHDAYREWVESMVKEVSAALAILEPLFRREVDPDYFGSVLGTLLYLGMERFCPGAWKGSQSPILLDETVGYPLTRYADAIVRGGRQVARRAHTRLMTTELGRVIDQLVGRQSRRAFTLLMVGDRPALAMILAQIIEEVNHGDNRTDTGSYEVHEEEAR